MDHKVFLDIRCTTKVCVGGGGVVNRWDALKYKAQLLLYDSWWTKHEECMYIVNTKESAVIQESGNIFWICCSQTVWINWNSIYMQQHFLKVNSTAVGNWLTQFLSPSQNIVGPMQRNKLNKNSESLIFFIKGSLYFYIHLLIRLLRVALQVEVHTPMTRVIVFPFAHITACTSGTEAGCSRHLKRPWVNVRQTPVVSSRKKKYRMIQSHYGYH